MGMSLSKANKKIAMQKAIDDMHKMIDRGLAKQHKLVMAWVMHTKFGFGTQRAMELLVEYENLWGCVARKEMTELTLDDIERAVADELDLYIREDGNLYYFGKGKGKTYTMEQARAESENAVLKEFDVWKDKH